MADMRRVRYIGDGAYITEEPPGHYVLTANDHDPEFATDTIHLGPAETAALLQFIGEA